MTMLPFVSHGTGSAARDLEHAADQGAARTSAARRHHHHARDRESESTNNKSHQHWPSHGEYPVEGVLCAYKQRCRKFRAHPQNSESAKGLGTPIKVRPSFRARSATFFPTRPSRALRRAAASRCSPSRNGSMAPPSRHSSSPAFCLRNTRASTASDVLRAERAGAVEGRAA